MLRSTDFKITERNLNPHGISEMYIKPGDSEDWIAGCLDPLGNEVYVANPKNEFTLVDMENELKKIFEDEE